jgi:hypothetical protein
MMTMMMTTTTTTMMTMMVTMMKTTTTKQQSTVGDNRGSRIGEKRQLGGVGDRGKSRGRQIGGVVWSRQNQFQRYVPPPPEQKKDRDLIRMRVGSKATRLQMARLLLKNIRKTVVKTLLTLKRWVPRYEYMYLYEFTCLCDFMYLAF